MEVVGLVGMEVLAALQVAAMEVVDRLESAPLLHMRQVKRKLKGEQCHQGEPRRGFQNRLGTP